MCFPSLLPSPSYIKRNLEVYVALFLTLMWSFFFFSMSGYKVNIVCWEVLWNMDIVVWFYMLKHFFYDFYISDYDIPHNWIEEVTYCRRPIFLWLNMCSVRSMCLNRNRNLWVSFAVQSCCSNVKYLTWVLEQENIVGGNYFLNQSAKEAYRSYLLAYNSHSMKDIFYVHQLDLTVHTCEVLS
jgi:hypothetical protein